MIVCVAFVLQNKLFSNETEGKNNVNERTVSRTIERNERVGFVGMEM